MMYYIVESEKSVEQAAADLVVAVQRNGFGVLHVHDLGNALRSKGVAFEPQCRVFEVCNPQQAAMVMASDMRLNMALPCRISVYSMGGRTQLGFIKPVQMLAALSQDVKLAAIARDVEARVTAMVDEAK